MSSISNHKILHIVNDNLTAQALIDAEIPGEILPWQDTLYEGPVINFEDINSLAIERAKYFAARGYGDYKTIENAYLARNEVLKSFSNYSRVILWFDYDLYGQLQLMQLVEWFGRQQTGPLEISSIQLDLVKSKSLSKPRISQMLAMDIQKLFNNCNEVTLQQTNICSKAWKQFTSKTPDGLLSFHPADLSTMPYLRDAIVRLVKEFPAKDTGLSRTEYLIIDAVRSKQTNEEDIFEYVQKKEPIAFMSKTVFLNKINQMIECKYPILKKEPIEQEVALEITEENDQINDSTVVHEYTIKVTNYTNQVLSKWADWIQLNGINRWVGGVHLSDGNMWRYDSINRKVKKTYI